MSDMFNLYKYENLLYTMKLTGKEIKDFLEMSYDLWTNQMKSPDDHLMLFNEEDKGFGRFKIQVSISIRQQALFIQWM